MDLRSGEYGLAASTGRCLRRSIDLVRLAGFKEVVGRPSLSGGTLAGVPVYSLSVSARK
jgi:hypothetical protein